MSAVSNPPLRWRPAMLWANSMRPLSLALWTFVLAFSMWTGATARAVEPIVCPATELSVHADPASGNQQKPAGRDQSAVHHHAGCGTHQLAAESEAPAVNLRPATALMPLAKSSGFRPTDSPARILRPPIA